MRIKNFILCHRCEKCHRVCVGLTGLSLRERMTFPHKWLRDSTMKQIPFTGELHIWVQSHSPIFLVLPACQYSNNIMDQMRIKEKNISIRNYRPQLNTIWHTRQIHSHIKYTQMYKHAHTNAYKHIRTHEK